MWVGAFPDLFPFSRTATCKGFQNVPSVVFEDYSRVLSQVFCKHGHEQVQGDKVVRMQNGSFLPT